MQHFRYSACVLSSLALMPMVCVLAVKRSWLALPYAAAAVVACLYHLSFERKFVRSDHALAWFCIACNLWLALHARNAQTTVVATLCILLAIDRYYAAHTGDRANYWHHHTVWHLWCGAGGIALALGYN
jgi:hypothetical protein